MNIIQLSLIAIGLAMDAFAVSVSKGLKMRKIDYKYAFLAAGFFGSFQALMPLIGWLIGKQFERYITSFDHWVAFALLLFVGVKMLVEAFKSNSEEDEIRYDLKELTLLAVATSIDALAVGISFAFLKTEIISAALIIGVITFAIGFCGVLIGNKFGIRYKRGAEAAGGIILILIGLKILLEHLGIINF